MVDAVLSYHTNIWTCGTAKFNARLAKELGVPFKGWRDCRGVRYPLFSLKPDEMHAAPPLPEPYDLFLHALPVRDGHFAWVAGATRAYAANPVIAQAMRVVRSDVTELWCPSTLETPPPRADLTVLTFGMAHKQVRYAPYYEKLRDLLNAHGQPYTILASCAVHENSAWDEAFEGSTQMLHRIFGPERVEWLGYLSDAALHREIERATACAVFYDPALRANNTTAWAVLERQRPLITNLDRASPSPAGMWTVLDIDALTTWPTWWHTEVRLAAAPTWRRLADVFQQVSCAN